MGIEKMQEFLGVPITGTWCKETVKQAIKLQKQHNLPETGLPVQSLKDLIQTLIDRKKKDKSKKVQQMRHPKNNRLV